jgi:hypothetical protein
MTPSARFVMRSGREDGSTGARLAGVRAGRVTLVTIAVLALGGCASGFEGDGRFLSVAGGQVHLWCDGDDGPTVLFLSAIGGDDTLVPIAKRISDDAVACFYSRPATATPSSPMGRGRRRATRRTCTSSSLRPRSRRRLYWSDIHTAD